jgi:hypothetical protein
MRAPTSGIYHDIDFSTYLSWDAINNSSLGPLRISPAHYKMRLEIPQDDTQALRLGRLCHMGKFEPAALLKRFWVLDESALAAECRTAKGAPVESVGSAKRTRDWEEKLAGMQARNGSKEQVTQAELDQLVGVCTALADHPVAGPLTRSAHREVSWVRKIRSGRKVIATLKGRIDLVEPGVLLADFKTASDITDDGIAWSIWRWGYHRQAAFYQDAWCDLAGEWLPFWLIFAEPMPPYSVRCAVLNEDDIAQGRREYQAAIERIIECRRLDFWPGPSDPPEFRLPFRMRTGVEIEVDGELVQL